MTAAAADAGPLRRALFLDRDGTLTEPRHYPTRPDELVLQPGIAPPLRALREAGFALVVVTNQSGLARGLFQQADLNLMHQELRRLLADHGVQLDGVYVCPHHPDGTMPPFGVICKCRKPAPGMLRQAAQDLDLDLSESWTIGDSACDIGAGRRAGTQTVLVSPQPLAAVAPDVHRVTTADALYYVLATSGPVRSRSCVGHSMVTGRSTATKPLDTFLIMRRP
ncbi:D-glycero-D-manno-heptose 1,7-bisphosphate phosphatase [Amycolatopsis tolypomycina]|uniref:D,D-heptose 1,7-bisphosphate phosphatase n=1 Tax=Amycolatopsis tolypomycina TaxID=208445 RepID=A0A1H4JN62_9PSEU|nr:HAD family hydrolase [Amycolatopsis tolypomycina]SEB47764.1 D-glycero-D-manno-heptose 1,7-bisphosphate phosphatase [Amycolatopsis tolypomycina]